MSKAIIDKIIAESLSHVDKKAFKDVARDHVNKNNAHYLEITYQEIHDTIIYNSVKYLKKSIVKKMKEGADKAEKVLLAYQNDPAIQAALKDIADDVWSKFVTSYNSHKSIMSKGQEYKAKKVGNAIHIYMDRMVSRTTPPFKEVFLDLFKNKAKTNKLTKSLASGKGFKQFKRATQFLHKGARTTGTQQLEIIARTVSGGAAVSSDESNPGERLSESPKSEGELNSAVAEALADSGKDITLASEAKLAAEKVILDMMRSFQLDWDGDEEYSTSDYFKNIGVRGTLGPNLLNPSGGKKGEPRDWANIETKLWTLLNKEIEERTGQLVGEEASQSTVTKITYLGVENILSRFRKLKRNKKFKVRVPRKDRIEKPIKYKSTVKNPTARRKVNPAGVALRVSKTSISGGGGKTINKRNTGASPINLLTILNNKLPQAIKENMSSPSLINRTGRFASSVKAVNIIHSSKIAPTLQYTYQRDPYGKFESDSQRDPKKLISRTLRELAAELAIGKFQTQRI